MSRLRKPMRQYLSRTREARGDLKRALTAKRSEMARAATKIIRNYHPDDYGGGGPCDDIAAELLGIALSVNVPGVEGDVAGWAGDHAFAQVWTDEEAYSVDVPFSLYERGAGYSWDVYTDTVIRPSDVVIDEIPVSYVR